MYAELLVHIWLREPNPTTTTTQQQQQQQQQQQPVYPVVPVCCLPFRLSVCLFVCLSVCHNSFPSLVVATPLLLQQLTPSYHY